MAKKTFTDEEIAFLKENPYTAFVDRHTLSFTVAFKAEFMRLYKEGFRPSAIVEQLGYPVEIIGKSRLNGISQKTRNEAVSDLGFHEKFDKRSLEEIPVSETAVLTDRQMINRLQCEVAYLRQELNFLKKISATDEDKKPGV